MSHQVKYEKMTAKKPLPLVENHACDSLLFFVGSLLTGEVELKTVYDELYQQLSKQQIVNNDYLANILLICCQDPNRFKGYWPKLREKIISNLKESKDFYCFRSEKKISKLLRCFPGDECEKIREVIIELREKSISDDYETSTDNRTISLIN